MQLTTVIICMYVRTYIGLRAAGISKGSNGNTVTEEECIVPTPSNDAPDLSESHSMMPPEVEQHYKLLDELLNSLESVPLNKIIDILTQSKIFSPHLINLFHKCGNASSLLRAVYPYSKFYDHSINKKILEECCDCCPLGVKSLSEFEQQINWNKSVSEYLIPVPSPLMIPDDHSYFTLMATRHNHELRPLPLKDIMSLKSLLLNLLTVPEFCCILEAIGITICYWRISKTMVDSITYKIQEQSDCLKNGGMFKEIAVYGSNPEVLFPVSYVAYS